MMKVEGSAISFILSFTVGVGLSWIVAFVPSLLFSPLDGGPLNFVPRLEASAQSPDGELIVKVFRRRDPSNSLFVGAEMFAKVHDKNGRLLFETVIGTEGAWDEMNHAYKISSLRRAPFASVAFLIRRM